MPPPLLRQQEHEREREQEKRAFFRQLDGLGGIDCSGGDGDGDGDAIPQREREYRSRSRAFFAGAARISRQAETQKHRVGDGGEEGEGVGRPDPRRIRSAPTPTDTTSRAWQRSTNTIKATPLVRDKGAAATAPAARLPTSAASSSSSIAIIEETPVPAPSRAAMAAPRRSAMNPLPSGMTKADSAFANASARKRKRDPTSSGKKTTTVPTPDQIFRGLSFFYVPNKEIGLRKLRIARAKEFGAEHVLTPDAATHVIVDKNLAWKDVEPVLSPSPPLDREVLTVVNEEYPLDCISFRQVLEPDQPQYRVRGCPLKAASTRPEGAPSKTPQGSTPQSTDESLQVKARPQNNPKRWDYVPPRGTPSHSEESLVGQQKEGGQGHGRQPEPEVEELSDNVVEETVIPSSPNIPTEGNLGGRDRDAAAEGRAEQMPPGPRDELSEYIDMMHQYKDLPLDMEDDDNDTMSVKGTNEVASESEEAASGDERPKPTRPSGQKSIEWQERFACCRGGTKDRDQGDVNPNARTIEVLQKMCDYYSRVDDHWRTTAYRKAIAVLRRQKTRIATEEEAYALPNVGRRLAKKIEEIATTDRLQRLEYAESEPLDRVLATFLKIYGVGHAQASRWIAQGFRTLEDLRNGARLNAGQKIGIEHYDDLNTRIPRAEVEALGAYVKKAAAEVDPAVELLIGGSYRRGSDSSGDIDFIVTKKGTSSAADLVPFLEEMVTLLTKRGFLTAALASLHAVRHGKGKEGTSGSKWHGCCVLPGRGGGDGGDGHGPLWRRIDFLLVPETEYGAALIYFTGNDIFNRSMRLLASKRGMRLNQRGLYREVMRGPGRVKVTEGELLEGRDERRIFEILGVKWREPWERWC